jgi:hypothetical protein
MIAGFTSAQRMKGEWQDGAMGGSGAGAALGVAAGATSIKCR